MPSSSLGRFVNAEAEDVADDDPFSPNSGALGN